MYVKVTNGTVDQFPYTIGQLRRDNPNISFPKTIPEDRLNEMGVYSVSYEAKPSFTQRTQILQKSTTPTLVNGQWTITYTATDKTTAQVTAYDNSHANVNREKRDELLKATDHYGLSDVTMSDSMLQYRQALRDLPTHSNWPYLNDADWPTKP